MSYINAIMPLDVNNYGKWLEQVEMALALTDIDLALTSPCPTAPRTR
jgi:hypothetical protein